MTTPSILSLLLSIGIAFAAASSGAIFKPGPWYAQLRKPWWTPPNWLFPVVWTILFTFMAVASWLVWQTAGMAALPTLIFYVVHLGVNAFWSYLFFGRHRLDFAMIDVVFLWSSIFVLIFLFAEVDVVAAYLMVPYIAWVTLAAILNLQLLQMNGGDGTGATTDDA